MLTVLNANDRNRAFIKFIGLFVVTMILIICAAYVDFRGLPEARKTFLEQKYEVQRVETLNQEEFVMHMERAKVLLDSISKNPTNNIQLGIFLDGKLNDLERTRQKDSSLYGKMNQRILEAFIDLRTLRQEKIALTRQAAEVENLKAKLQISEAALDAYRSRPPVASGY